MMAPAGVGGGGAAGRHAGGQGPADNASAAENESIVSWRNLIWMLIILCVAAMALVFSRRRRGPVAPTDPAMEDLAPAVRAYQRIRNRAYPPLPREKACRGAVEGMVRQVDEFSTYVPPEQADRVRSRLAGTLHETGLCIAASGEKLLTVGSLPGSPAAAAGVGPGREVLASQNVEARYLTLDRAREMLRHPDGPSVTVRLRAPGGRSVVHSLAPVRFEVPTVTGIARDGS